MGIMYSELIDYDQWIELVKEVESLFGEMSSSQAFQEALKQSIKEKRAICAKSSENELQGGIIICKMNNEILWFAVSENNKGKGIGGELLCKAIQELDESKPIFVQTFSKECTLGLPARKLYIKNRFIDYKKAEINPAGFPTVIMKKVVQN